MEEQLKPDHYKAGSMDVIAFCHYHDLNFGRGNVVKYCTRAGKKKSVNPQKELEDLKKARVYLDREIDILEPQHGLPYKVLAKDLVIETYPFEDAVSQALNDINLLRKERGLNLFVLQDLFRDIPF